MKFIIKLIKRILVSLLVFIGLSVVLIYITDNQYIFRGVQLTYLKGNKTANIDDSMILTLELFKMEKFRNGN